MRPLRVLAATAAALVLLAGCSTGTNAVDVNNGGQFRFVEATPQGKVIPVADRSSAPQFGGSLLDGSAFDSAGLVGKVAVINFWGQWCAPCRVETPEFQRVYADVRDRGVSFLGINVKDNDQLASAYLRNAGIEYPSVFDPRGEVALAFPDGPLRWAPVAGPVSSGRRLVDDRCRGRRRCAPRRRCGSGRGTHLGGRATDP